MLSVVLRAGSARVWGLGPWLPSDSPGCTGGQWGPLTSAGRQECRLHTSSPQEGLSEDICEFIEDHIQENLPVSWSHCLSAFLPLPTGLSCPWGCCVCTELPGVGDEGGVLEISGGVALWASASPLSTWWPEPWAQLPAMIPVGLVLGSEANHLQASTTKHQGSFFKGNRGARPSLWEKSSCLQSCWPEGRQFGLGWAGLLSPSVSHGLAGLGQVRTRVCLARGRSLKGPHPCRNAWRSPVPSFRKHGKEYAAESRDLQSLPVWRSRIRKRASGPEPWGGSK